MLILFHNRSQRPIRSEQNHPPLNFYWYDHTSLARNQFNRIESKLCEAHFPSECVVWMKVKKMNNERDVRTIKHNFMMFLLGLTLVYFSLTKGKIIWESATHNTLCRLCIVVHYFSHHPLNLIIRTKRTYYMNRQ